VSDEAVEATDASEIDLPHDEAVDEESVPLSDDEMLEIDPGEDR
jgi:hypothetical protein